MGELKVKTSNRLKKKLKRAQEKSKTPVVRKTISKTTGKISVSWAQCLPCRAGTPRSGAAGLKTTQVYPDAYGQMVAKVHKRFSVWVSLCCNSVYCVARLTLGLRAPSASACTSRR